jgi:hypothetical protein
MGKAYRHGVTTLPSTPDRGAPPVVKTRTDFKIMAVRNIASIGSVGLRCWPIALVLATLLSSIAILAAAVQSPKRSLVPESRWDNADGFFHFYPNRLNSFLSNGLIDKRAELFLNVRPPEYQTITGRVESYPFRPADHMVIPLLGLTYNSERAAGRKFNPGGASIVLKCLVNGRVFNVLDSPSQDWFERSVSLPIGWCPGDAKLVAEVFDDGIYLGIGTPFAVSAAYAWVAGKLSVFISFGIASSFFFSLFIPLLLVTSLNYLLRASLALLSVGLFGYVSFVIQAINVAPKIIVVITLLMLSAPSVSFFFAWRAGKTGGSLTLLSRMSIAWVVLGLMIILPLMALPVNSGSWAFNFAFYPVNWSTDNQLPTMMARYVIETLETQPPTLAPWAITDRGFVPAGLVAGELFMLDRLGLGRQSPITYMMGQMIISLSNACVFLLVLQFPTFAHARYSTVLKVCAILGATPFFFFNVVYAWPKMAAGTLALWAILVVIAAFRERQYRLLCLAAPLLAFAFLFHAAAILLLPAILLYVTLITIDSLRCGELKLRPWEALTFAVSILASIALLMYHDSFGKRTSYGLTFLLTGHGVFGLSGQEIADVLFGYYRGMTLAAYVHLKWEQILVLFWPLMGFANAFLFEKDVVAQLRVAEFLSAVPSLLLFTPFVLLVPHFRHLAPSSDAVNLRIALLIGGATLSLLLLIVSCELIVPHFPYTILLSALVLAVLVADKCSRAVDILLAAHVALFIVTWVLGSWWL